MRHHNKNRKFGREKAERNALINLLAESLIGKGKIKTTEAKAKELRPFVEKLLTMAKKGDLSAMRIISSRVGKTGARKIIDDIAPKYKKRNGGYTRIIKMPARKSDASKMAVIEFV